MYLKKWAFNKRRYRFDWSVLLIFSKVTFLCVSPYFCLVILVTFSSAWVPVLMLCVNHLIRCVWLYICISSLSNVEQFMRWQVTLCHMGVLRFLLSDFPCFSAFDLFFSSLEIGTAEPCSSLWGGIVSDKCYLYVFFFFPIYRVFLSFYFWSVFPP